MALQITTTVEFDNGDDPEAFREFIDRYNELLERAFSDDFADMEIFDYETTYEQQ